MVWHLFCNIPFFSMKKSNQYKNKLYLKAKSNITILNMIFPTKKLCFQSEVRSKVPFQAIFQLSFSGQQLVIDGQNQNKLEIEKIGSLKTLGNFFNFSKLCSIRGFYSSISLAIRMQFLHKKLFQFSFLYQTKVW